MKKYFYASCMFLLISSLTLGVAYPLVTAMMGQWLWRYQAEGSLLLRDGQFIGSELIGQEWKSEKYFSGRLSASNYDPMLSGARNLSPINEKLTKGAGVEQELLLASGSGLDPHISKEAAIMQIPRIANIRNLSQETIEKLVLSKVEKKTFGVLGQDRVNILTLNVELDTL